MTPTLAQINAAILATLGSASGIKRRQNYDELTEGMNDTPTLQVYWDDGAQSTDSATDRKTFRGGARRTNLNFNADLYATQRNNIGENMRTLYPLVDALIAKLEDQTVKPYFSLDGLQSFAWTVNRMHFDYSGVEFVGARFVITVHLY